MHIVQSTDLREKSGERFVVAAPEVNCARPIVAPLDHRARLQAVRTHLVDVTALAVRNQWPIAKRQQILQMARPQVGSALLHQSQVVLVGHIQKMVVGEMFTF